MSWLSALLMLLKYLPALVDAIKRGEDFIVLHIQLGKVEAADAQAQATKDTSGVEKLLNPSADSPSTPTPKP